MHCDNHFNAELVELLPLYRPTNVIIAENVVPCRYCGNQYTRLLMQKHEDDCSMAPVSDLIVDMLQIEKPLNGKLTVKALRSIQIRKNLVNSFMLGDSISTTTATGTTPGNYQTHVIQDSDTMAGLAIRYGTNVGEIRRLNHLASQNIHERSVIKVPINGAPNTSTDPKQMTQSIEELMRKRLAVRFMKENTPCDYNEAVFYLEIADYNYEKAVMEFKEDSSWAKTQKIHTTNTHQMPITPMKMDRPAKMKRRGCILCVC